MHTIICFGEILFDVYPTEAFIGGAPLNFAAHLARHGESAMMLSALGEDELGAKALGWLEENKIDTSLIKRSALPTGRCNVTIGENGVPSYELLSDVAWDEISTELCSRRFDALYFGTLALRSEHNRATLERLIANNDFGDIFVDVNIRKPFYSADSLALALSNATILKISDEELSTVASLLGVNFTDNEKFCELLCEKFGNIKLIVLTLGANGALCYEASTQKLTNTAARKANVASTVGAGDSFSAAFLHKYLGGSTIESCLDYASRLAALVVSHYEAVPDYSPEEI